MALAVWLYFWLWHKVIHPIKYWKYRPKWVVVRHHERRLTLKRGYSTFVLDECDHHFNKMAVDSLRYHLSPQCVVDNEHNRERYEALLARLQEPSPRPTPEEQAGIDTWKPLSDPACTSKGKVLSDYRGRSRSARRVGCFRRPVRRRCAPGVGCGAGVGVWACRRAQMTAG